MNTLGKILVVLNFVFAMLVIGFLTYDFATRDKNQLSNQQFANELDVTRRSNQVLTTTNARLQQKVTKLQESLDEKTQELALAQSKWAVTEAELVKSFKDAEERGKNAEINLERALAAQERMKKEVELLKTTIEDREGRLVIVQNKLKDTTDLAMSLDRDLKFSQERNQILLTRVQELERSFAELVSGQKSDVATALPKDPTQPNPPLKFMKGVVERVDATDKSLVRVSLGTDHGLNKNQTLEVYRLSPNAEYIGMIRIEDAHHHTSVGRLVRTPGTTPKVVREGDTVSSTLSPR